MSDHRTLGASDPTGSLPEYDEFSDLRGEFNGFRAEMVDLRQGLHADFVALQRHLLSIIAGTLVGVLGLVGAFVAAQF